MSELDKKECKHKWVFKYSKEEQKYLYHSINHTFPTYKDVTRDYFYCEKCLKERMTER